jgi:hypothetical protein
MTISTVSLRRIIAVAVLTVAGCGRTDPPELQQGLEVYHDDNGRFSFRPPAGWMQALRAGVQKGDRTQDSPLVKYKYAAGKEIAFFQVSAVDLPEGTDVTAFLDKALTRDEKRTSKSPEDLIVGGIKATRDTFSTKWDREPMTREVVAVRRGPRVFFFTATFPPSNKSIRETVRKLLDSVTWDDA